MGFDCNWECSNLNGLRVYMFRLNTYLFNLRTDNSVWWRTSKTWRGEKEKRMDVHWEMRWWASCCVLNGRPTAQGTYIRNIKSNGIPLLYSNAWNKAIGPQLRWYHDRWRSLVVFFPHPYSLWVSVGESSSLFNNNFIPLCVSDEVVHCSTAPSSFTGCILNIIPFHFYFDDVRPSDSCFLKTLFLSNESNTESREYLFVRNTNHDHSQIHRALNKQKNLNDHWLLCREDTKGGIPPKPTTLSLEIGADKTYLIESHTEHQLLHLFA